MTRSQVSEVFGRLLEERKSLKNTIDKSALSPWIDPCVRVVPVQRSLREAKPKAGPDHQTKNQPVAL